MEPFDAFGKIKTRKCSAVSNAAWPRVVNWPAASCSKLVELSTPKMFAYVRPLEPVVPGVVSMVRMFLRFGSVLVLSTTKSPARAAVPTRSTMFSGTMPCALYVASLKSNGDVPRSLPPLAETLALKLRPASTISASAATASQSVHFETFLFFMIGEFSLVCLSNEERIMYEESSDECQRGDTRREKI